MASTVQNSKQLEESIKMWNIEGIQGTSAVKLNLKQYDQKNIYETSNEMRTARRNVIQKLLHENIKIICQSRRMPDVFKDYQFKFIERSDHLVIKNRDKTTSNTQSPYMLLE